MKKLGKINFLTWLLIITSTSSFAQKETHAGSNCVRRSGGATAYDFNGAIYNTSSTSKSWVLCNIPKNDQDGWLHSAGIEFGWVRTLDLNNSHDIKCRLRGSRVLFNGNNNIILTTYGTLNSTTGFGTHNQTISLVRYGSGGFSLANRTQPILACELPPKTANGFSKIFSYTIGQ